jgi:Putative methyltransferase
VTDGSPAAEDWLEWHRPYDDPNSHLARRLTIVQQRIREALDHHRDSWIRIVSMCAGQGRDLVGALAGHPRRDDVDARLVELDPRNVEAAGAAIEEAGLRGVDLLMGDAGTTDSYVGAVPADLVLACGVFGNVSDDDIAETIRLLPQLCARRATVIWTRHRLDPDLTPTIRGWFADAGFDELHFDAPSDDWFTVGVHRLRREPQVLEPGTRMFEFVGFTALHS